MGKHEIKKMDHPCPHTLEDPTGKNRVLADMLTYEGTERQCCTCGPGEYMREICNEGDRASTQCSKCPPGGNPFDYSHQKTQCTFPAGANPTQPQSSTLPGTIQEFATQRLTPANIDIVMSEKATIDYPSTVTTSSDTLYSTNATVLQEITNQTEFEGHPPVGLSHEVHLFVYAFALISAFLIIGFLLQKAFRWWRRRRSGQIATVDVESSLPDKEPLVDSVVFRCGSQSTPVLQRNAEHQPQRDSRQSEIFEDSRSDDELLFDESSAQQDADSDKQTSMPFGAAPAGQPERNAQISAELKVVGHFFLHIGSHESMSINSGDVFKLGHHLKIGPTNLTDMDNKYKSETARFLFEVFQVTRKEHRDDDLLNVLFANLKKASLIKLAQELDNELKTKIPGYKSRYQSLQMNDVPPEIDGTSGGEARLDGTEESTSAEYQP